MQGYNSSYRHNSSNNFPIMDNDQPLDTVSSLIWDPYIGNDLAFLSGSWDGIVRYYQVKISSNNNSGDITKGW